ncbi:MAG: hypothetical protein DRN35_02055 [Thermoplasmata archaeon]|nr:MAG: hypothetical protein DRN28_02225 [Thermoplasmata archaeon]RLF71645.1 MAG: hypothetical protein DRN35_02055 [Thermoplasmata archaeon]HDD60228.1 sensor histidine kinase [Euryarchaeota archaeon]
MRFRKRKASLQNRIVLFVTVSIFVYFLVSTGAIYLFMVRGVERSLEEIQEERRGREEEQIQDSLLRFSTQFMDGIREASSFIENTTSHVSSLSELELPMNPLFQPYIFVPPLGREEDIWNLPPSVMNFSSFIQSDLYLLSRQPLTLNAYFTFQSGVTVFVDYEVLEAVRGHVPLNPITRPWYVRAVEEGSLALSPMYMDLITGNYLVTLSAPIYNSSGLVGVIGVDLNITYFINIMQRIRSPGLECIFLLDTKGNILASTEPEFDLSTHYTISYVSRQRGLYEAYSEVMERNSTGILRCDDTSLIAVKITGTEWLLIGELDAREALAPFMEQSRRAASSILSYIVVAVVILVAILALIYLSFPLFLKEVFEKPLQKLQSAAEEIGKGNYGVQIPDPLYREFEPITVAFNRMSGKIKRDKERMRMDRLEIERAKRAGELFLEIAAHDVKNLLTGIRLNTEYIKLKKNVGEDVSPEAVDKILSIVDSATDTLDKIRDLYRIKMFRSEMRRVDLKEFIRMAEELTTRTHPSKIIEFEYRLPEEGMYTLGDTFLVNLFLNLFQNAVRYTEGDVVKIEVKGRRVKENGKCFWEVSVADRGRGIPHERKKEVFKRFSTWDSVSGSGLGLAIVRELVERAGGRIRVEDRVAGDYRKGTRFVILLPCYEGKGGRRYTNL